MPTLFERYFPIDDEQEESKLKDKWVERVDRLQSLVLSPGWEEFKHRMDLLINHSEVRAGAEQDMLYQIGKREALRDTRALMSAMEQELKNEQGN